MASFRLDRCLLGPALLASVTLVLIFASCGGEQTTTTTQSSAPPASSASTAAGATIEAATTTSQPFAATTGQASTTTTESSTSTAAQPLSTTTLPDWIPDQATAELRDFILGSDQIPEGADVIGAEISGDWAGAFVSDGELASIPILLQKNAAGDWTITEIGKARTQAELLDRGVPEAVAAYLACDT